MIDVVVIDRQRACRVGSGALAGFLRRLASELPPPSGDGLVLCLVSDEAMQDPQAPRAIFDLFAKAKRDALKRRIGTTLVPWAEASFDETLRIFGGDPLPYGLTERNSADIETLAGYLHDQKLIGRVPRLDDLFWPGSASWNEKGNIA